MEKEKKKLYHEKHEKEKKKLLATENEATDGDSLARSAAKSPKGCEHDANNKRRKRLKRKD